MKYKDLEIWKCARTLVIDMHHLTIRDIPRFEMYETGSQIRRAMKSGSANIVEGFGRRRYKLDFIRFLVYAESSVDETVEHLEILYDTASLKQEEKYLDIHRRLESLGKMLNAFISKVESSHKS
jgi:four helix bundle protein